MSLTGGATWRCYRPALTVSEDYRVYEIRQPFELRFTRVDDYDGQLELAIPAQYAKYNKPILKINENFYFRREGQVYRFYTKNPKYPPSMCPVRAYSVLHILEKIEKLFDLTQFLPRYSTVEGGNIGDMPSHYAAYCIGIPEAELSNFAEAVEKRVIPTNFAATVFAMLKAIADEVEPQPVGLRLLKDVDIDPNHTSEIYNMHRLATFMEEDSARLFLDLAMKNWWIAEKIYRILEWIVPLFPRYCTIVNAVDILQDIIFAMSTPLRYLDHISIAERVLRGRALICYFQDLDL